MPLKAYCTAALTSLPDSVSYITFLFSEWHIDKENFMNSVLVDIVSLMFLATRLAKEPTFEWLKLHSP